MTKDSWRGWRSGCRWPVNLWRRLSTIGGGSDLWQHGKRATVDTTRRGGGRLMLAASTMAQRVARPEGRGRAEGCHKRRLHRDCVEEAKGVGGGGARGVVVARR